MRLHTRAKNQRRQLEVRPAHSLCLPNRRVARAAPRRARGRYRATVPHPYPELLAAIRSPLAPSRFPPGRPPQSARPARVTCESRPSRQDAKRCCLLKHWDCRPSAERKRIVEGKGVSLPFEPCCRRHINKKKNTHSQ